MGENDTPKQEAEGTPKIQVDEDWKESVAKEKERLRAEEQKAGGVGAHAPRGEPTASRSRRLPEPDVKSFIAGLCTQALMALGEIENPITGERNRDLADASYLIDVVAMLQGKMQGNLAADEEQFIQSMLTDLRLRYVNATSRPAAPDGADGGPPQD